MELNASAKIQAVTPEPQVDIICVSFLIEYAFVISLISLFFIKYPFSLMNLLKGIFNELGICPYFSPGRGSSSMPLNLPSARASIILIFLLYIALTTSS